MIVVGHLLCTGLLYVYARRRIGPWPALLPAALLLTLGPAWQNILWPFQIGWLISLAAGLGALLRSTARARRRGRVRAAGAGAGLFRGRHRDRDRHRRRAAVGRRSGATCGSSPRRSRCTPCGGSPIRTRDFVAPQRRASRRASRPTPPAGALAALAGLTEATRRQRADRRRRRAIVWGRPLASSPRSRCWSGAWSRCARCPARVVALLAMAGGVLAPHRTAARADQSPPDASRYLYVGALFVLLLAVELARGVRARAASGARRRARAPSCCDRVQPRRPARGSALPARSSRRSRGRTSARSRSRGRRRARLSRHRASRAVPFVTIDASTYFAAARALGSPAVARRRARRGPEHGAPPPTASSRPSQRRPAAAGPRAAAGTAAAVDAVTGGACASDGGCVRLPPDAVRGRRHARELQVTLPRGGLLLTAGRCARTVSRPALRGDLPGRAAQARLAPGGAGDPAARRRRAPQPWHVRLTAEAGVSACTLRAAPDAPCRARRRRGFLLAGPTVLAFFSGGYFAEPRLIAAIVVWALVLALAAAGPAPLPRGAAGPARARRARAADRLERALDRVGAARRAGDRERRSGSCSTPAR